MDEKLVKHSGVLGSLGQAVDVLRGSAMDYVKLGVGATAVITLSDLVLSRVLVSQGRPLVPEKWSPLAIAGFGILSGEFVRRRFDADIGTGMIAGGVGVGVSALLGKVLSPAMRATAAAAEATEAAGAEAQQTSGFGFGRAFAPSLGAFAGISRASSAGLLGVGTPNISATGMFNGATVAIEEQGQMSGATVRIEDENGFASALN